ncbi:hypothetical protein [Desulfonatronospira sp.]|uniref:hypothetical protein n=1 Tax=Desulfonatronospira sp. TaxID=1962951 RepID=UPI0025BFAC58|nr:hypothetical protein [Desulfonatronospira sp.]
MQAVLHILSAFAEITDFRNQPIADEIETLVDRFIDLKKDSQDTSRLENHIDQLVYQLYDLTSEVSGVVEASEQN